MLSIIFLVVLIPFIKIQILLSIDSAWKSFWQNLVYLWKISLELINVKGYRIFENQFPEFCKRVLVISCNYKYIIRMIFFQCATFSFMSTCFRKFWLQLFEQKKLNRIIKIKFSSIALVNTLITYDQRPNGL